jgi:hypothetical protein
LRNPTSSDRTIASKMARNGFAPNATGGPQVFEMTAVLVLAAWSFSTAAIIAASGRTPAKMRRRRPAGFTGLGEPSDSASASQRSNSRGAIIPRSTLAIIPSDPSPPYASATIDVNRSGSTPLSTQNAAKEAPIEVVSTPP